MTTSEVTASFKVEGFGKDSLVPLTRIKAATTTTRKDALIITLMIFPIFKNLRKNISSVILLDY